MYSGRSIGGGRSIGSITVLYKYQYFTFRNLCSCGYDWTAKKIFAVPCVRLKILRFRACGSDFFPCGSGCGSTAEPLPISSDGADGDIFNTQMYSSISNYAIISTNIPTINQSGLPNNIITNYFNARNSPCSEYHQF